MNNDFMIPMSSHEDPVVDKTVWSTLGIEKLMVAIDEGYKVKGTPFHEGRPDLRRGNIVFEYTTE